MSKAVATRRRSHAKRITAAPEPPGLVSEEVALVVPEAAEAAGLSGLPRTCAGGVA